MKKVSSPIDWIALERSFVLAHRGLAHPFFDDLPIRCKSIGFLRDAFRQIYHVVLGFPFHMAAAIGSCRDERVLRALVHNLYAEVGGDHGQAHIPIYRKLLQAVGCSTSRPSADELWPETIDLEATCGQLYRSQVMGTKLGSLFAFEMMSSPMVAKWDSALRTCSHVQEDDFEFFTIHIDIEADHVDDITECTMPYVDDETFCRAFHVASDAVMTSLAKFWDRMMQLRAPNKVASVLQ